MSNYVLSAADGSEYPVGALLQIGREDTCHIVLGDPLVSRLHATLWMEQDALYARDEYSSNGTYVNEAPVTPAQPRKLLVGDQLRVGNTTFSVRHARVTGNLPPTPARRLSHAAEQTDIAFSIPRPLPPKPTQPAPARRGFPWMYAVVGGLALAAALTLLIGCGLIIYWAIR
jgi:predicted component of type VI protein secretion system